MAKNYNKTIMKLVCFIKLSSLILISQLIFFLDSNNGNSPTLAEQVFSPEQFIFHQNSGKGPTQQSQNKPAISFQQQQFQNGGSLTVTNSHVTVTTHTSTGGNGTTIGSKPNKQFSSKPKESTLNGDTSNNDNDDEDDDDDEFSSTTTKPTKYSFYNAPQSSAPKRIPLLPTAAEHSPPLGHPGLPQVPAFRLPAQGFRLPVEESAQEKHQQELQEHQHQVEKQLHQQQDHGPQEQHQRELEQHQQRLEQLQQQEHEKQQRDQEQLRQQQEQQRQEQERQNQHNEEQQRQHSPFEGYRRHTPQV